MHNCTYLPIIYVYPGSTFMSFSTTFIWEMGYKTADKIYEAFSWAKHVILQKMELGWTKIFEGYETNQTAK